MGLEYPRRSASLVSTEAVWLHPTIMMDSPAINNSALSLKLIVSVLRPTYCLLGELLNVDWF